MNKLNSKFIKIPNLPENRVCEAIIGEGHREIAQHLEKSGIKLYEAHTNHGIHPSAANHADMAAFYCGDGEIIIERNQSKLFKVLKNEGFTVTFSEKISEGPYPSDILLNSFTANGILFCKEKYTDCTILERFAGHISDIKQGYAKCSAFTASYDSVITDDLSVYKALVKSDVNCLLIDKGDIFLDGIHCGFIGGSGFMYDSNTAVFFGDIEKHGNYRSIKSFLLNIGIHCEKLSNDVITDIGGIVPLTEINS